MKISKNPTQRWNGSHRGVNFEICNWTTDGSEHWTYYLLLYINRIPEENNPNSFWLRGKKNMGHIMYNYYKHNVLNNIDWHCGITWYSKEGGFDGDEKVIKVGCDYSHLYDEGKYYDINEIQRDVENAIDSFIRLVPNYKYWCRGNGKLYDLKDGILSEDAFYSKEYWYDKEWFKELWDKKSTDPVA